MANSMMLFDLDPTTNISNEEFRASASELHENLEETLMCWQPQKG